MYSSVQSQRGRDTIHIYRFTRHTDPTRCSTRSLHSRGRACSSSATHTHYEPCGLASCVFRASWHPTVLTQPNTQSHRKVCTRVSFCRVLVSSQFQALVSQATHGPSSYPWALPGAHSRGERGCGTCGEGGTDLGHRRESIVDALSLTREWGHRCAWSEWAIVRRRT